MLLANIPPTPPARREFRAPGGLSRPLALGLLTGVLLCFASGAAPAPATADDRFAAMDKDGNGLVVLEEFRAANPGMSERAFAVIDSDGDGGIERAEWAAFMRSHAAGMRPDGMRGGMGGAPDRAPRLNNMPGDPMIPPPDGADLPLMRPPSGN